MNDDDRKKTEQIEQMLLSIKLAFGEMFEASKRAYPNDQNSVVASVQQLETYCNQLKNDIPVDRQALNQLYQQCQKTAELANELSQAKGSLGTKDGRSQSRTFFLVDANDKNHIIREYTRGERCRNHLISWRSPFNPLGSVSIATSQVEMDVASKLGFRISHDSSWLSNDIKVTVTRADGQKMTKQDWDKFFIARNQKLAEKGIDVDYKKVEPSASQIGLSASDVGLKASSTQAAPAEVGISATPAATAPSVGLEATAPVLGAESSTAPAAAAPPSVSTAAPATPVIPDSSGSSASPGSNPATPSSLASPQ
ncbi:MAG: hypothetical protein K0Q57_22 [Gammaproteobacteria bacterium]|nr:hypothetical protein [Gammaproteobacteria bacterium]